MTVRHGAQVDGGRPLIDWDSHFGIEQFAVLLGSSPGAVSQMAARGTLPEPAHRLGRRPSWTQRVAYDKVLSDRPQRSAAVPALYPRSAPAPARFRRAHVIEPAGDNAAYVVYEWDAADALGGVVALAYPIDDGASDYPPDHIGALAAELGSYRALAITTTEEVDGLPSLWAVDGRDESMIAEPNYRGALQISWMTLAALLRTDIPWWPQAVRHESALLAWRPGAPRQTIAPYTRGCDPRVFLSAVRPDTPKLVADALHLLHRQAASSITDESPYSDRRGFVVAAEPDGPRHAPSGHMPIDQLRALLHDHIRDERVARRIAGTLRAYPLITGHVTVPADESDPLARRWADRLMPHEGPGELGHYVAQERVDREEVAELLSDPDNPDSWAIRDARGTTYGTVGSAVPASGPLRSASLTGNRSAFFEDSDGRRSWPMPISAGRAYNSGYPGDGPQALLRMVVTLTRNSRFDLAGRTAPEPLDEDSRLWMRVSTETPPVAITEHDLAEFSAP